MAIHLQARHVPLLIICFGAHLHVISCYHKPAEALSRLWVSKYNKAGSGCCNLNFQCRALARAVDHCASVHSSTTLKNTSLTHTCKSAATTLHDTHDWIVTFCAIQAKELGHCDCTTRNSGLITTLLTLQRHAREVQF